jgi:outer membrane protein assembly factor BamB
VLASEAYGVGFRGSIAALAFAAFSAGLGGVAQARGEGSYRLPEVRATVPPPQRVVHVPAWASSIDHTDGKPAGSDLTAHGDGIIAFPSGGRICGFREADGRNRWCATPGASPAFAGGTFAYSAGDGTVHAVDARSGAPRWLFGGADAVSAAGDGFTFVGRERNRTERTYGELSPSGEVRWTTLIPLGTVWPAIVAPPYLLQPVIMSGATLHATQFVMQLGPGGGRVGEIENAWTYLDSNGSSGVFSIDRIESMEDHELTFDVEAVDLRTAKTTLSARYEPDYDVNLALYFANRLPRASGKRAGYDQGWFYGVVGSSVYRYRLGGERGQHPLLVSTDGMLAGPYRGAIYVARKDGVWMLRPRERDVEARLVAPSPAAVSAIAIAGRTAYIAFANGRLRGVDALSGRTVLDAPGCPARRIGITAQRVYFVCDSTQYWRFLAFAVTSG